MIRFNRFLTLVLTVLVLAPAAIAQQESAQPLPSQTGNPANWPAELDAVIAAPDNHRVLMENDHVRVLEVQMVPRETENLHHHQWPSVLYIMEAGHFIDRDADGNVIMDSRQMDGPLPLPFTMWKDAEAPHSVENLGDEPIRLIRVELKQPVQNGASEAQRVLAIEDAFVEAEVTRDEATLRRILDDGFVFNHSDGTTTGKEKYVEAVLNLSMTGQTLSERTVVVDGSTAVIAGTTDIRFTSDAGEDTTQHLRYTSVYVKRGGQWRFFALHMNGHARP